MSRGINSECRVYWGAGGSSGRALLNELICASMCVYMCISTPRQYSPVLCRWIWNRSCRLAALYKYINNTEGELGTEQLWMQAASGHVFLSYCVQIERWKCFTQSHHPSPSTAIKHTPPPPIPTELIAGPMRQLDGTPGETSNRCWLMVFSVRTWFTNNKLVNIQLCLNVVSLCV